MVLYSSVVVLKCVGLLKLFVFQFVVQFGQDLLRLSILSVNGQKVYVYILA